MTVAYAALQRVLYLEDNAADADLGRRALARSAPDTEVEIVTSVAAASERLQRGAPEFDVVLADLRLPDGSGLDLLAHVRAQGLPLAFVVLTGSGDEASALIALKAGADDYLSKHGNYGERLARVLSAALDRFRSDSARQGRLLRVLYAEHNRFDIDLSLRHFAEHAPHFRIEVVGSGEEVLAKLPEDSGEALGYDLLLLDYQLPALNALEVAKTVRDQRGLDLPIVLVTGQGDEDVVAAALRLGLEDYVIKKSGYLSGLPNILENALRHAQLRREQSKLRQASSRLTHLLSASPTILYALRVDGDRLLPVWVSDNITRVMGYTPAECLAPDWWSAHLHGDDRARVVGSAQARLLEQGELTHEYRFLDAAGGIRWLRDDMRLIRDARQQPLEVIGSWNDLTDEHAFAERQRLYATALESTRDGVMITGLDAGIITVNPAFCAMTGYAAADVIGKNPRFLQSGRHDRAFYQALWASLTQSGHWQGEIWNRRADGEIYPQWATLSVVKDEQGQACHYVGVFTDLTKLKRSEEQVERLAHYDPLTDLPNRLLLRSLLQHGLDRAQRQGGKSALLIINLDHFKNVNESLGHTLGDELLLAVAVRLQARLRKEDTLGRLAADEFAAVIEGLHEAESAEHTARDLLAALAAPFMLADGHEAYARASVGISLFPQDGTTANELLRTATAAMSRAKEGGGNQLASYTGELGQGALERLEMETALRRVLSKGELLLHYQPKLDLASGVIIGAEALLRWQRPGVGMVPPDSFIPLAEKTGLIIPIGAWVIDEACRQIRAWSDAGLPVVKIAVNVSARQFASSELEGVLAAALSRHAVAPRMLTLELTESMLMAVPDQAIKRLERLREIGVGLSLDDFGTGYSSLAYLSRFPVDELKIDRSFVTNIVTDPNAANIATSVIALAHRLHLKVVAEGVETEAQLGYLKKNRCDQMQGYLFSMPLPADAFSALLSESRTLPVGGTPSELHCLLVVDDEPSILSSIRRVLRGQGYRVLTANSALEGLEILAREEVQVILSDQRMPQMSGTEFLARVKLLHPDTVRLVISGYTQLDSVIDAVNQGSIYKFLTKPWEEEQLREHLREAFAYYEAIIKPRSISDGLAD
ncbi:MAG: Cyclic di-GMP phosphodiesterase Gmr [Candidatus Accumulibacter appositus]|uniref:Cyclic di-GMP phosphodiesterase Gmr n=1 Tax=Candidatus Accumulibacter appositus TaxID=1454003 RepID=A0A011PXI2_9PROT|nr:EAL domain-containing protein [Accumulibacter sp.]EXI81560.1 MAG: Cyclic di-GMP phosphodiesterase Gmr [Candidatus Accumulibacter appositus]HRF05152.1 EAL domain-containing protein [Accumulibacter sp.]